MSATSVYVGVDVACGRNKRLPLCCVRSGDRLTPLQIPPELTALIPTGPGNLEVRSERPFGLTARGVSRALQKIATEMNWRIERIAIDAPARPPLAPPRQSETALGHARLSSFRTPALNRWPALRETCVEHLTNGGLPSRLPFANMIWMLYGFELYQHLRVDFDTEVIEVYPAAIVHEIEPGCEHKSTDVGYKKQLRAVATHTGWDDPTLLEQRLKETVPLTRHDRLDAFMAAWVASLPADKRRAYGDADDPDDSIWVPIV